MISIRQENILKQEYSTKDNGRTILSQRGEAILAHKCDWENCTRCPLGGSRGENTHVLLSKNHANPERLDVLFVGEGPGSFEELMGIPFIGPTGRLLRDAIRDAKLDQFRWAITNAVACRPKEGNNNRQPNDNELEACAPRVRELVEIYKPRLIILVGSVARDFTGPDLVDWEFEGRIANVQHPSFVLRMGGKKTHNYIEYVAKFKDLFAWLETKK